MLILYMQFEFLISGINFLKGNWEDYKEILTLTSTIYVGLLTFVYPKIFEAKEKIKEKSEKLYKKLSKELIVKHYFFFIIAFTIINLFSFFTENNILLWLNIILCILSMIASWWIYEKILDKYYYREYEFIDKLEVIDYNKQNERNIIYNDNLELCQNLSINMLARGFHNEHFNKYIGKILSYFELYIDFLYKKENSSKDEFSSKDELESFWNEKEKNNYFVAPFYRIVYINQESKRLNAGYEFNINITRECYEVLKNFYKNIHFEKENNKKSIIYFLGHRITEPIWIFRSILLSKIENKIFEPSEIIFINLFFELIIDFDIKYNDSYYTKSLIKYGEMKTVPIIFDLIKSIIDNDYNFDRYLKTFAKKLHYSLNWGIDNDYKKNIKNTTYSSYIHNLDFSILSYLLYTRKYDLFKKYYNTACENSLNHIVWFFNNLLLYLINKEYSIFNTNNLMVFEKDKPEYKYYVIFYILINKKNYINCRVNDIIEKKNSQNKDYSIIDFEIGEIKNAISLNEFDFKERIGSLANLLNIEDIDWIKKEIDKFFNIHEIINDSELIKDRTEDYKKFILQVFKYIKTKIEKWQKYYQEDK